MMIGSDIAADPLFVLSSFMATVLVKLLAGITPPPVVTPKEYDGWELKWKALVFRPACTF